MHTWGGHHAGAHASHIFHFYNLNQRQRTMLNGLNVSRDHRTFVRSVPHFGHRRTMQSDQYEEDPSRLCFERFKCAGR